MALIFAWKVWSHQVFIGREVPQDTNDKLKLTKSFTAFSSSILPVFTRHKSKKEGCFWNIVILCFIIIIILLNNMTIIDIRVAQLLSKSYKNRLLMDSGNWSLNPSFASSCTLLINFIYLTKLLRKTLSSYYVTKINTTMLKRMF